ncbi:MAG: SpoIIE family protein phosphatase [Phycisphaerae bacterium]|nr:SpoIIE family protein phosphatase [Phycisphaerae bacterium]
MPPTLTTSSDGSVTFQTLIGPSGGDFTFAPTKAVSIGRAAGSDICLLHDNVSRRHASAVRRGDQWFLTDEGSKSGTHLNGVRLAPGVATLVRPGDIVKIGPWTFRVLGPGGAGAAESTYTLARTIDDGPASGARLERSYVNEGVLASDKRLRMLVEFIQRLGAAQASAAGPAAEQAMASAALDSVLKGSGYARGAVLRRAGQGNEVEVIAAVRSDTADTSGFEFSTSLVNQASRGELAILTREAGSQGVGLNSIADLRIHSALCAPILLGDNVEGFLYLDARNSERTVRTDAAGFCEAAAKAYGLALANLRRISLEERQRTLQEELTAARRAQDMILPPRQGDHGPFRYAMRMQPGLYVAGDLFDFVPLGDGRVMACIGDVVGHGIGPAMLMAIVQSHLHAQIRLCPDPAQAVMEVNRYACPRAAGGKFVSLWVGVFEADGTLRYIDCGHGHWMIGRPGAGWSHPGSDHAGIPIGIEPDYPYETQTIHLPRDSRVLLHSDGITEQRNPGGDEMFGKNRLAEVVSVGTGGDPTALTDRVFASVRQFAGLSPDAAMDDDATAAVIEFA